MASVRVLSARRLLTYGGATSDRELLRLLRVYRREIRAERRALYYAIHAGIVRAMLLQRDILTRVRIKKKNQIMSATMTPENRALLETEIAFRKSMGSPPVSISYIHTVLASLGYRLDRTRDCVGMACIVTGLRGVVSYPVITTGIMELDTRRDYADVNARRDANFDALQVPT